MADLELVLVEISGQHLMVVEVVAGSLEVQWVDLMEEEGIKLA
jgi:hypothetical protein